MKPNIRHILYAPQPATTAARKRVRKTLNADALLQLVRQDFGLGKKNLSAVFTTLVMLVFLINQAQQLSCWLFQAALEKKGRKRYLWDDIRSFYWMFHVDSMETILKSIAFDGKQQFKKAC